MPHLRLEVPEEWLERDFIELTGFDARQLLNHLVDVVADLRMEDVEAEPGMENVAIGGQGQESGGAPGDPHAPGWVPLINKRNLKHAIIPVAESGVGGDRASGFIHLTFAAGNDTQGRTATVRRRVAETLGHAIDTFVRDLPQLGSVTVHVQDIDRDRGYSTTAERKRQRGE